MVLLHVKRSEKEGFLYEVPAQTDVDVVLRDLVVIHNLRQKVNRLSEAAAQLAALCMTTRRTLQMTVCPANTEATHTDPLSTRMCRRMGPAPPPSASRYSSAEPRAQRRVGTPPGLDSSPSELLLPS